MSDLYTSTLSQPITSSSNCVKLNVGGMYFATSKATLTRRDNLLSVMISGNTEMVSDKDGSIFIDREGKHFA